MVKMRSLESDSVQEKSESWLLSACSLCLCISVLKCCIKNELTKIT